MATAQSPDALYRICDRAAWTQTEVEGTLVPSAHDRRDGFIHLSMADQVTGTLRRFFAGREDLLLLTVARERLSAERLRFEIAADAPESRGFPHYYGNIPRSAIERADPLVLGPDGRHELPASFRC